ncbi:MFS monocarboxylate transporter [Paramyrothecium foliicola]|nr:MFS monocarboxylate transporter [Paramyrothecium foliicola]
MIPGFHFQSIVHASLGRYAGLRVEATITIGQLNEPQVTLHFKCRNGKTIDTLYTLIIPLRKLADQANDPQIGKNGYALPHNGPLTDEDKCTQYELAVHTATALLLPSHALFYVKVPSQATWAVSFASPPIDCNMPSIDLNNVGLTLSKFIRQMNDNVPLSIRGQLKYTPDNTLDFMSSIATSNLLDRFPSLNNLKTSAKLSDEQRKAVDCLGVTKGGYVFGTGVPGSGKSAFATEFQPVALAIDEQNFQDILGPQRQMSLFKRVEKLGLTDFKFTQNQRVHGDAHEWAQKFLYNYKMDVSSATYLGDLVYANEFKVGSFANQIDAQFIRRFLVYIYRTAPISNAIDYLNNVSPPRVTTILFLAAPCSTKE